MWPFSIPEDMEVDNWQSSYEAAERLHRSIVAEVSDPTSPPCLS